MDIGSESKLLVVDDDALMRGVLVDMLRSEGYQAVLELADGEQVNELVEEQQIDLILLDISMPGKDGLTITRELRARHEELGIILVTGKGDDIDRVVGIEVGADDYLVKPIQLRELQARVKNLLRRVLREKSKKSTGVNSSPLKELQIGPWQFIANKQQLVDQAGNIKALTHGEQTILAIMTRRPGIIFSRAQLLQEISRREWSPDDRTVDVLMGRLRNKIEHDPKHPRHLLTVRGAGYKCQL